MPLLHRLEHFNTYQERDPTNNTASGLVLEVNCVWPVSGQYGPGSRVLYYALILTCVLARKQTWIKAPCLVATLLIPAVAALHGIVLAAVHTPGAVDMDLYGVFQVCSIGVLTALETLMQSRTYFDGPGRNMIFVWSGLILAGLLSLTIEFYRTHSEQCPGHYTVHDFPYGNHTCGITCSVTQGPFSPIRTSLGTNIAVIPSPTKLTFNTAMLLSAACCIPAILSLIFVWMKIREDRQPDSSEKEAVSLSNQINSAGGQTNSPDRQTEHVPTETPKRKIVHIFRHNFEMPLFIGAVLAILIFGERNLFSKQCRYMTEPLDNIGQWGPIVGTGLAVIGSLYILFEAAIKEEEKALRQEIQRARRSHRADSSNTEGRQGIFRSLARLYVRWFKSPVDSPEAEVEDGPEAQVLPVPGEVDRNENYRRTSEHRSRQASRERSSSHSSRLASPHAEVRSGLEAWPSDTPTSAAHHVLSPYERLPAVTPRRPTLETATSQTKKPPPGSPEVELAHIATSSTARDSESVLTRVPTIVISPVEGTGHEIYF